MEKSNIIYEQEADRESNLDLPITAICHCKKETKDLTYRALKNKWPYCSCRQSMKILTQDAS
jgi:hypothetical protein